MSNEPSRKTNVALIVSICINVVLVGVIAMALVRVSMIHPMWKPFSTVKQIEDRGVIPVQMLLNPRLMMRAAPGERDKIRAVLEAHRDKVKALRQAAMSARREVMRDFESSNFDKAAFRQSLARMHASDTALESEVLDVMAESAATLTPEERKAVLSERPPLFLGRFRGNRRHGFGGGPGGGPEAVPVPDGGPDGGP